MIGHHGSFTGYLFTISSRSQCLQQLYMLVGLALVASPCRGGGILWCRDKNKSEFYNANVCFNHNACVSAAW